MDNNKICFVAGKSGGHIVPCLAIAKQYRGNNSATKVLFFSADTDLDLRILDRHPLVSHHIPLSLSTIHSATWLGYFTIIRNLIGSFFVSLIELRKEKPTIIITTGGVTALPVCYAGYLLGIPITVHCLDAVPGKAIRSLERIAQSITTCFIPAQRYFKQSTQINFPLHYKASDREINLFEAHARLNLCPTKKTILILGGSQGSQFLNNCIKRIVTENLLPLDSFQVIHQIGTIDFFNWDTFYKKNDILAYTFRYEPNLSVIYTAADIIICRGGAGTLFEALFFNTSSIVIPLITDTTDHQVTNAQTMAQQHPRLFQVIEQKTVEENILTLVKRIYTAQ